MTYRDRRHLTYLGLIAAVLASSAVCNLFPFPPAGNPLPDGVIVRLINRTNEIVQAELAFLNQGAEVRRTRVRLSAAGPGASADVLPTRADTFNAVAVDARTVPPAGQDPQPLILRQFVVGVDFEIGDTLIIFIDPVGEDCNGNGQADVSDIAGGESSDCNTDGVPDECQTDADGDGLIDACDGCPNDSAKNSPGACGCGVADGDRDGDGTPDCHDGCPDDVNKSQPGSCGCGVSDADSDEDGTPDCLDGCPHDPNKLTPGTCGCGISEADSDEDGTPDCVDGCPEDPNKVDPGVCGCGNPELIGDVDEDGVPDCLDVCPGGNDNLDCDANGVPDDCGQFVYWTLTSKYAGSIERKVASQLPCTTQPVSPEEIEPGELDVDPVGRKIYWISSGWEFQEIRSADLDGGNNQSVWPVYNATSLAVDHVNRRLYWLESIEFKFPVVLLLTLDIDDPNAEPVLVFDGLGLQPYGLAVDPMTCTATWTQIEFVDFQSELVKLDLCLPELFTETLYSTPQSNHELFGTAIDGTGGKVYWVEQIHASFGVAGGVGGVRSEIRRMDLGGDPSSIETIVVMENAFARDIAVDATGGKVYWTIPSLLRVERADLSGANREPIAGVPGPYFINGLGLLIP